MQQIRTALFGTGFVGRIHLEGIRRLGYVQIYARLEYYDRALEYSRRALEVNPNKDAVRRNVELLERLLEQRRNRMI